MRSLVLFFLLFGITISFNAQTFNVCKVERATKSVNNGQNPVKTYENLVNKKWIFERNEKDRSTAKELDRIKSRNEKHGSNLDTSKYAKEIVNRKFEAGPAIDKLLIETNFHPFVATMHLAYAEHYPMTISPDMIWLLIAQGFAVHVNENAETLRSQFVDFDGKKKIDIRRDEFVKGGENNDWANTFPEFAQKIEANTGAHLLELVTSDFSTTGSAEKIAFQITLMDAMKSYFQYSVTTACGIPEITLEGTPEDWKKIEEKAKLLAQYDLEWWIDDLLPVLTQLTQTASGKPDIEFWESCYKWRDVGSGNPLITGWVLHLFPYFEWNGTYARKKKQKSFVNQKPAEIYIGSTKAFPSGFSQADFLWNYNGAFFEMEFVACFVGCHQDPETLSLRPEISWAVLDKQVMASEERIEDYKKGGDKTYREFMNKNGAKE